MRSVYRLLPHIARHRAAFVGTLVSNLLAQSGLLALALLGAALVSQALAGRDSTVAVLATALPATAVLCALATWRESHVSHDLAYRVLADLRGRVFTALRRSLPTRHTARRSGDLGAVALSDVETLEWLYAHTAAQLLVSLTMLGATTALSVALSPWLVLTWLPCLLVVVALPWLFGPVSARHGARLTAANAALQADVVDTVQGMRELTGAGALERRRRQLARATRALTREQSRIAHLGGAEAAVSSLAVAAAGMAALAMVASGTGGLDPRLAPVALTLATVTLGPISQISALLRDFGVLRAAAERVDQVLNTPPAVPRPTRSLGPVTGALTFERVGFRYTESGPPVLEDVSFTVHPGEIVALVGPSGSGKSTCVALALRLWDPDTGTVRIGGVDLRDLDDTHLRSAVAAVPQRIDLLTGTVRDNIALADPDATPARIRDAALRAGVLDPASGFRDGLDTHVAERGQALSGGQRARVALARALLRNAPVLVLDEAMAQVDAHAEAALQSVLRREAAGRAVLVVAHRDTTIRAADRVLTLRGGTIREEGPRAPRAAP
ncbi:ABC transporter ATP-binding protein [Allostreptomyces psammosilenae]|uniref:ABC-type multidrug transport system fused ATPase/permease subunit n=1 Tax=Allostreptomyces psammosilenae TaxID=1892865 RepID=A0A852ZQH4_9ACTN|nr:ABC transporter ATP-binding protein [Allostreptomyces psammosilenae]NYI04696.1 ABC-type multidrug transport system fused ATPase/permease subunit [Allostreptomyces psammosilenae]